MRRSHRSQLALFALIFQGALGWAFADDRAAAPTLDLGAGISATLGVRYYDSRHGPLAEFSGSQVTAFSLHRKFAAGTAHFGYTYAASESQRHLGVSTGRITLAYFQGRGASFSKTGTGGLYQDLNHYFFHGGSRLPFRVQGGGVDLAVGAGATVRLAGARVGSPGLEERTGRYAGLSAGGWSGGIFTLQKGGADVGRGFNFAFRGVRAGFEYQEVRSEWGAHLRRAGLSWRPGERSRISVALEDARNPLYSRADERRVMFRYQRSLGRRPSSALAAAGSGETTEGVEDQTRYGRIVAVGLGLGVVAAAVSSGGDDDGALRFASADQAAFDVLNRINPVSVRENREHGGWIYRNLDGSYNSTLPVAGGVASVNIGNPDTAVPQGTSASASYHTHGGPDPRYDNENFSPQDVLSDNLVGLDGYLGTPAGLLKKHIVATDQIVVLGTIAN